MGYRNMHAIQLFDIKVIETSLIVNSPNEVFNPDFDASISFRTGHAEFNKEDSVIVVGVKCKSGSQDDERTPPLEIRVELMGVFKVDQEKFPIEHIDEWAEKNAPFILLPYLREHVYSLTLRAGIKNLIIPMFNLPLFKLENKEQ